MSSQENELSKIKVAVILPICDSSAGSLPSDTRAQNGGSNHTGSSIVSSTDTSSQLSEAACFSKPLISFTLKAFERICWIKSIILCGTATKEEQIQEIINEYTNQQERIKYLCTTNLPQHQQGQHHTSNSLSVRENTVNRILKYSLNLLKREEAFDIILVHDPNIPIIDEEIIANISLEALKCGASCLCTTEIAENLLFKLNEASIETDEDSNLNGSINKSLLNRSTSGSGLLSEFIDSSLYRIGAKPQAFQYSIFKIMFDSCSEVELDDNTNCIVLAKKYADIRAKLVFNKHIAKFSNRICCISNYLKEVHKQAIFVDSKFDKDACHLQSLLRDQDWNIELAYSHREIEIKINEMTSFRNTTDTINLIKFCEDLNDLSNLRSILFGKDDDLTEQDLETNQIIQVKNESKSSKPISDYLVLLIKQDTMSNSLSGSIHDAIRNEMKKSFLSEIWNITIIYSSVSPRMAKLISYLLTDRDESIKGQIFECID